MTTTNQIMQNVRQRMAGARAVILCGLLATAIAPAARANLVVNGSFENGTFSPNADAGVVRLLDGDTTITGWTVLGGGGGSGGDIAWESGAANPWNFKASQGDKFLDLTGYNNDPNVPHGGIALSQIVTTTAGQHYWLSFDVGSSKSFSDGVDPQVTVSVNGTPSPYVFNGHVNNADGPGGAANHWEHAGFAFTASGNTADISFLATTPAYDRVIHLDDVSLVAVPEASTMIAGAGSAGIMLLLGLKAYLQGRSRRVTAES